MPKLNKMAKKQQKICPLTNKQPMKIWALILAWITNTVLNFAKNVADF